MEYNHAQKNQLINFLGIILLLAGIYGLALSTVNTIAFSRYPTEGVYSLSLKGSSYNKREEDCRIIKDLGKIDNLTEEKQAAIKSNLDICWGGIVQERKKIQIWDFTQSAILFVLGISIFLISFSLKKDKQ